MIEDGVLENPDVDAAFGCHLWSGLETGTIDICDGPVMAASHYFTLTLNGRGGHAGFAHESIDPIFVSSHVIQAVQVIQTRDINALNPCVIMFTCIQGGANATIIPEKIILKGSIRFLYGGGEEVLEKFEQTEAGICKLHNCDYDLEFKTGNQMLSNDPAMALLVRKAAIGILPDSKQVTARIQTMAGEDFSDFANKVPSAFAFIGISNPCKKTTYPHHHPRFDIDETALATGAELYATIAIEFLKEKL